MILVIRILLELRVGYVLRGVERLTLNDGVNFETERLAEVLGYGHDRRAVVVFGGLGA